MSLKKNLIIIFVSMYGFDAKSGGELTEILDSAKCVPPKYSSWRFSESKLVAESENILIGQFLMVESTFDSKTVMPDFSVPGYGHSNLNERQKHFKWKFKVLKRLKGEKSKDEIEIVSTHLMSKDTSNNPAKLNVVTCNILLNFEKGGKYLIFLGKYHPNAYKKIEASDDAWVLKIKSLLSLK